MSRMFARALAITMLAIGLLIAPSQASHSSAATVMVLPPPPSLQVEARTQTCQGTDAWNDVSGGPCTRAAFGWLGSSGRGPGVGSEVFAGCVQAWSSDGVRYARYMFDQWTIYTPATWVYGRTVIVNAGLSANSLIGTRARLAGTLVTSDQGIIGGRVQVKLSGPVLYAKLNQQTGIWGLQTSAPGTMSCTVGPSGSFTVEALISPVPGLSPAAPDNLPYVYVCLPCAGAFISDVLLLE